MRERGSVAVFGFGFSHSRFSTHFAKQQRMFENLAKQRRMLENLARFSAYEN
jgi:hypothetical protein